MQISSQNLKIMTIEIYYKQPQELTLHFFKVIIKIKLLSRFSKMVIIHQNNFSRIKILIILLKFSL